MMKGSCLCGGVRYEVDAEPGPITACHCQRCRKVNGSAFLAAMLVRTQDLRLVSGAELVTQFESLPGVFRCFCRNCGSPLFSRRGADPTHLRIRIGALDTPLPTKIGSHIFVGSKAEWFDILDDAPRFETRPPV